MSRVALAEDLRERRSWSSFDPRETGPFITISRQYGCYGFSLGLLLMEILNEEAQAPEVWQIYNKDILSRLATETSLAQELIQQERRSKPRLLVEFFRYLSTRHVPSGYEIRHRVTTIIRGLATKGHSIVVGQGGAAATFDLPNGLSIRLEAPEDWRIRQVSYREGIGETEAHRRIHEVEGEREYLRKIYARAFPRTPPFNLTYDCSIFTLTQIAQHIVYAMKLKGIG